MSNSLRKVITGRQKLVVHGALLWRMATFDDKAEWRPHIKWDALVFLNGGYVGIVEHS